MKISARDAYDRLFSYFGLRARDGYLSAATGINTPEPAVTNESVLGDVYHILYGDENLNFGISEICKKIEQMPGKLEYSKNVICITPYSDSASLLGVSDIKNLPVNDKNVTNYSDQGLVGNNGKQKKPSSEEPKLYTIKNINKKFDNDHNRIDVIQVFPSKGISELADTDILTLYLSTINNLNMSQAIPYVDVMITVQGNDGSSIASAPFSFGGFLEDDDDAALSANFSDQSISGAGTETKKDRNGKEVKVKTQTVASMEIFTSPQTLVDAEDVAYNENFAAGSSIDAFRPFLAIENLGISVVPANAGLIAFKTANMKLKLFDRGRLAQIAPLVSPSRFGVVKFDIEYGWSHPGGGTKTALRQGIFDKEGRLSDSNDDRMGQLIDSMRVTESYQVTNSSFNFEQDGSVSVDLKLAMLGTPALTNSSLKFSVEDTSTEEIEYCLQEIQRLLSNAPRQINLPAVISGGADTFVRISPEDGKNLKKFMDVLVKGGKNTPVSSSTRAAATNISKLIKSQGKEKSLIDSYRATKESQAKKFIEELQSADDPFIRTEGLPNVGKGVTREELLGKSNTSFASLGGIILNALGPVFQSSGDVIFIFNCFNRNAGAMFDHNIAQMPIRLTGGAGKSDNVVNLQNVLIKQLKKSTRITPEQFLSILNEFFILKESNEAYGLSDLYQDQPVFDKEGLVKENYVKSLKIDTEKNPSSQFVIENVKVNNLSNIYGPARNHPTFTLPRIAMKIDVKPGSDGRNIIKVIIFDQACSNIGDIQEAFNDITINGYLEKDSFENPMGSSARGSQHGVIANQVFEKMLATELFKKYTPDTTTNPNDPEAPTLLQQLEKISANGKQPIEKFEVESSAARNTLQKKLDNLYFMQQFNSQEGKLRDVFYKMFPVIIYGSMGSGIISAQLSSNQNPALTTIALQKQEDEPVVPTGMPMLVHPTQLSMEVFGTPLFKYSQKFFVDFGTGTSADNFYAISGIDMNFGPGEFKTSLKMVQLDVFGRFMKTRDTILKTLVSVYKRDKEQPKPKKRGRKAAAKK